MDSLCISCVDRLFSFALSPLLSSYGQIYFPSCFAPLMLPLAIITSPTAATTCLLLQHPVIKAQRLPSRQCSLDLVTESSVGKSPQRSNTTAHQLGAMPVWREVAEQHVVKLLLNTLLHTCKCLASYMSSGPVIGHTDMLDYTKKYDTRCFLTWWYIKMYFNCVAPF